METKVGCSVKLENVSEVGDIMSRAYFGIIIGSALKAPKGQEILGSQQKKRLHIVLTDASAVILLHLTEILVAAEIMGFRAVIHVGTNEVNVLEIERLVYAKMLNAEVKVLELPDDYDKLDYEGKTKWYEDFVNAQTRDSGYDIPIDVHNTILYGLAGIACCAHEIIAKEDVSAIVVSDVRKDLMFSALEAFTLFAKAYNQRHPEKSIKIIPAGVSPDIRKDDEGEFSWVINYNQCLHETPVFEYMLNLKDCVSEEKVQEFAECKMKGKITKQHFAEFFHIITGCYPTKISLAGDDELSLSSFKKIISQEEKELRKLLKAKLSSFESMGHLEDTSRAQEGEKAIIVEETQLAKGFMTSFKITRTFAGKLGSAGLAAVLAKGADMEKEYELRIPHICVVLCGSSVDVPEMDSIVQWGQIENGELFYVEAILPNDTEVMKKVMSTIAANESNVAEITRNRGSLALDKTSYLFKIGCSDASVRYKTYKALESIEEITITRTTPEITPVKASVHYDPPVKPLALSSKPFEDDDKKYILPKFTIEQITKESCEQAEQRLLDAHLIYFTPIFHSKIYSNICNCNVYLQLDNLQQTGSFKQRGSANAILKGIEESGVKPRHVVAVSAGNHSQGVSLCCRYLKIPCTIVCPKAAPESKMSATKKYGAAVEKEGANFEEALEFGYGVCNKFKATFVHPFNEPGVIEGQSTTAVALHREVPDLDTVLVNVGGGGLIAGVASYLRRLKDYHTHLGKRLRIIGLQGGNVAPLDASKIDKEIYQEGMREYVPKKNLTIADGCNVKEAGGCHDAILHYLVDEYYGVPENYIATAVSHLLISTRTLVEGAGAIGVAALMYGIIKVEPEEKVGIIICGGNINIDHFQQCTMFGMRACGRVLTVDVDVSDSHASLEKIVSIAEACCLRYQDVQYLRSGGRYPAEIATIRLRFSSSSFSSQVDFLIRLVQDMDLEPSVYGKEAIPNYMEVYKRFDDYLKQRKQQKAMQFEQEKEEWYERERARLKELKEKYPKSFLDE